MWFVGSPVMILFIVANAFRGYKPMAEKYSADYGEENAKLIYPDWSNVIGEAKTYFKPSNKLSALIMTFASFIPILLYAPYAIYKQGWDSLIPTKDWGKSRAEIADAISKFQSKFLHAELKVSENPAYVGDKPKGDQSAL